jgi:PhnB protein
MKFIPYLSFEGNAEEALNFYIEAFNGELQNIMRYSDMPLEEGSPAIPVAYNNKVLHAALSIGQGLIYLSDTFPGMTISKGNNVEINIEPESEAELRRVFDKLALGGRINMPVEYTFWGSLFGSVTDKFGVGWSLDLTIDQNNKEV